MAGTSPGQGGAGGGGGGGGGYVSRERMNLNVTHA